MMVLEVGDVPQEPVIYSPRGVPVLVTSTSSLALEHKIKAKLVQCSEKSSVAHGQSAKRLTLADASLRCVTAKGQELEDASLRSAADELAYGASPASDEEELQDPKEVLQKFLTRFKHMAVIKPVDAASEAPPQTLDRKRMLKPEAQHFIHCRNARGCEREDPSKPSGLGYPRVPHPTPYRATEARGDRDTPGQYSDDSEQDEVFVRSRVLPYQC